MKGLLKLFGIGRDPQKVDRDIAEKKKQWQDELMRLELLAIETRVQGRNWNASNDRAEGNSMGSSGDSWNNTSRDTGG
jgi:hypothetical protein